MDDHVRAVPRVLLYVPAASPRKLARMGTLDAEGFIIDLEDSVEAELKPTARQHAAAQVSALGADRELYVRTNPVGTPEFTADVETVVRPGLRGLVLPKVAAADQVRRAARVLTRCEQACGLPPGTVRLLASIETADGVQAVDEIARATPRLALLSIGYGDLRRDLRVFTGRDDFLRSGLCAAIRSRIVLASRAAGLEPPQDGASPQWGDLDRLAAECRAARRDGFAGKRAIHPDQLPTLTREMAVSAEERRWARSVVVALGGPDAPGAARLPGSGEMADRATLEHARRLLRHHRPETAGSTPSVHPRPAEES